MRISTPPACASIVALTVFLALGSAQAKRAPNFIAKDLSGQSQKLSSLRGHIVVLSFWATWCGPCQEELPRLSKLSQQYAGKPVQFVAASIDSPKDRTKIQPFLAKNNIALNVWIGPDSGILQDFGLGDIVPGTVVIDENGEIVGRIMGEAQDQDVRSRVDWLLNERQGPAPEPLTKRY
ncbi:MAG TPA: TlpA disulfide reductase family protein [Acidobacteriaceae bacterium]